MEIKRDAKTRTISPSFPTSATFAGEGYAILRNLFANDLCGITTYEAYEMCGGAWYPVVRANIIISDCDFKLNECTVSVSFVDDGIGARIANNRRIPIRPPSEFTKNQLPQSAVPEIEVEIFDPTASAATYLSPARRMYDWLEAMEHAVRYITDTQVSVQSAWYAALPDDERYAITTGYQLRTAEAGPRGIYMQYSFEALFTELAIKYDLWIFVTRDAFGLPVVNIEPYEDTFSPTVATTFPAVQGLEQGVQQEALYASVSVGSESGLPNLDAVQSLPFLVMIGHSEEQFHFEGVCNMDTNLDLVNKWGIDTNLIQRTVGGNDSEDDLIFIVQYDVSTLQAVKGDDYTPSFQYNPGLLNFRVLERYPFNQNISVATADPSQLVGDATFPLNSNVQLGNLVVQFPTGSDYQVPSGVLDFFSANDPGGNFQLSPGRYTAPVQGFYSFSLQYGYSLAWQANAFNFYGGVQGAVQFARYDVANTLISTSTVTGSTNIGAQNAQGIGFASTGIVLNPGDYVTVSLLWTVAGLVGSVVLVSLSPPGWTLTATGVPGGGTIAFDGTRPRLLRHQWQGHIPAQQWSAMMSDPRLAVAVSPGSVMPIEVHPISVSRSLSTGVAQLDTITKRSNIL